MHGVRIDALLAAVDLPLGVLAPEGATFAPPRGAPCVVTLRAALYTAGKGRQCDLQAWIGKRFSGAAMVSLPPNFEDRPTLGLFGPRTNENNP